MLRILGTAAVRPARIVTSAELDAVHGREPGTSHARSGVSERAWAGTETASELGAQALGQALATAGVEAGELDAVIGASAVPEQPMPTTAVLVARRLGLAGLAAFDVNASCLSLLTALDMAGLGLAAARWRRVAIVSSEIASVGLVKQEAETGSLFGDGAAAVVLGPSGDGSELLGVRTQAFPDGARTCQILAGGTRFNITNPPPSERDYLFRMDSYGIVRATVAALPGFVDEFLASVRLSRDEIDLLVPHQTSGLGMRYLRKRLGFADQTIVDILASHGNQVAASLPTALHTAIESGRLRRGQIAMLLGTGAGLVVGAAALRY